MKLPFLILFFCFSSFLFSQFNWNAKSLEVCTLNVISNQLENCNVFKEKALININEKYTVLKIISETYRYTYYIVDMDLEKIEDLLFMNLVRDDGEEYLGIMDVPNGMFKIVYKDDFDTYLTVFYL